MKILILGNVNSFLIIRLVEQLKMKMPALRVDAVTLETICSEEALKVFDTIYHDTKSHAFEHKKYIKVLFMFLRLRRLLRKVPKGYDALSILYVSSVYRFVWKQIRSKSHLVSISVFGSDFYRSGKMIRWLLRKMLRKTDVLTTTNDQTLCDLRSYYPFLERKGQVVRFGLAILDEMDGVTLNQLSEFRESFDLLPEQTIIACGYNASINQKLEEVLDSLTEVKNQLTDTVVFFQFPDAVDSQYVRNIRKQLDDGKFDYRIIDRYLTDRELAVYRLSVNVMIQVQDSDQLSGAMQEHLYGGARIITGKWLPYKVFDDAGVCYWKVNKRSEIGETLLNIMKQPIDKEVNKKAIAQLSKWEYTIEGWLEMLQLRLK